MLVTFAVIQLGVNVLFLLALIRLMRERETAARQAREREERLEALAAELCALGREATGQGRPPVSEPASTPARMPREDRDGAAPHAKSATDTRRSGEEPDRVRAAAALLACGMTIEDVAKETALLPGEIQVLRNLHRTSAPPEQARREHDAAFRPGGASRRAAQKARVVHA
jgi:hypothetical protein